MPGRPSTHEEQLRDDLQAGYEAIRAGVAKAVETARGMAGTVRLGVMGAVGHEIRDVIDAFRGRYSDCDVARRRGARREGRAARTPSS